LPSAEESSRALDVVIDRPFNVAAMSVGGAESRHAAALAQALGVQPAPQAFETAERAVPAGSGV